MARRRRRAAAIEASSRRLQAAFLRVEALEEALQCARACHLPSDVAERLELIAPVLAAQFAGQEVDGLVRARSNATVHNSRVTAEHIRGMTGLALNHAQ